MWYSLIIPMVWINTWVRLRPPRHHSWCAVWPLNNAYVWARSLLIDSDLQHDADGLTTASVPCNPTLNTAIAGLWSNVRCSRRHRRRIFVRALCTYLSPSAACDAPRSLLLLINATFNPPCCAEHTRLHTESTHLRIRDAPTWCCFCDDTNISVPGF